MDALNRRISRLSLTLTAKIKLNATPALLVIWESASDEELVELFQNYVGWKRDLTREGIESNPGPSMKEILKNASKELGVDEDYFDDFAQLVKSSNPGLSLFTEKHVNAILTDDEWMRKLFKGDVETVKEKIQLFSKPFNPLEHIEEKKRFIVGAPARTGENFIVPFNQLSLPKLLSDAESGGCRLVQGPYRSSKTSHLIALIDELKIRGMKHISFVFDTSQFL